MDILQKDFYNNSDIYFDIISSNKLEHYSEYLSYVLSVVPNNFFGSKLLDVGCGTGQSSFLLRKEGFKVIGVDISDRFIKFAKDNFEDLGLNFECIDVSSMTFDTESFDVVTAYNVVEHFGNLEKTLIEMLRVLKTNGVLIINSPNLLSLWHPVNAFIRFKGMTFEGKKNFFSLVMIFFRNLYWVFLKKFFKSYNFNFREPNFEFSFPDNDATWYLNPVDLKNFFKKNNCDIISYQEINHIIENKSKFTILLAKVFPSLMGITRITVKKR